METITIVGIILVLLVLVNLLLLWFIFKKPEGEGMGFLQKEIQDLRGQLDRKIGESTRDIHESVRTQIGESNKIVREVTEGLTKLGETNRQVIGFADQLQKLQDILTNPKQRGVLGEYYLETVLQNVLPPGGYKTQYAFNNGDIVDAVVFVKDKIVPVDSKFSLENYNRMVESRDDSERKKLEKEFVNDLKTRIQETAKYIRPSESTTEFAFMFIPSEGIYYDLLVNKIGGSEDSLIQRAASKYHVIIVSSTSFLAYLQTVLQGLKALQIEESAKEIRVRVEDLGRHIGKYDEYYRKLGDSLSTTVNHYNSGYKELGKIDKDVLRITGNSFGSEPLSLARPERE